MHWLLSLLALVFLAYTIIIIKESKEVNWSPKEHLRIPEHIDLSKDQIIDIQKALRAGGYLQGRLTGILNAATIRAIRSYQVDNLLTVTGEPNAETLKRLSVPAPPDTNQAAPTNLLGKQTTEGVPVK